MAVLQRNRLVADAGNFGALAFAEALAPDAPAARDADVFETFAPDEAVVMVAVAEVLILIPLVWFGVVEAALGGGSAAIIVAPGSSSSVTLLFRRMEYDR
jgi:hypothetical protein